MADLMISTHGQHDYMTMKIPKLYFPKKIAKGGIIEICEYDSTHNFRNHYIVDMA